jgi:hypothetical protein
MLSLLRGGRGLYIYRPAADHVRPTTRDVTGTSDRKAPIAGLTYGNDIPEIVSFDDFANLKFEHVCARTRAE